MPETKGIKETLEFAKFLNACIASIKEFKARGLKPTPINLLKSFGDFLPATLEAPDAFAGADQIPSEWGDLSKAEAALIVAEVNAGFELKDQLVEAEIEELFAAVLNLYIAMRNLIQKNEVPV